MDADAYLAEKDSDAYRDFHMRQMGTLEQEYVSREIVDGHVVTVTRTVPGINIPWALRRAILAPPLRPLRAALADATLSIADAARFLAGARRIPGETPFHQAYYGDVVQNPFSPLIMLPPQPASRVPLSPPG